MDLSSWVDVIALSKEECGSPILGDLKYATRENFIGRSVDGYDPSARDVCLMTKKAARDLCKVQNILRERYNYGLVIYDAFRPLRAVRDFKSWLHSPPRDPYELERKRLHYPDLEKQDIASRGYLATTVSTHCFGSTVDLSLVSLTDQNELEMGAIFDFFGKMSHVSASEHEIGKEGFSNRRKLIDVMDQFGFKVYQAEFWHFDHRDRESKEPMDFEIAPELRGLGTGLFQRKKHKIP